MIIVRTTLEVIAKIAYKLDDWSNAIGAALVITLILMATWSLALTLDFI